MALRKFFNTLVESIAFRALRSRNFVAMMGVANASGLAALLDGVDKAQPYRDVYGLHNLRWTLFYPNRCNDGSVVNMEEPQALVLALVFDGRLDDVLNTLLETPGGQLREILSHCDGFADAKDALGFLKERETPPGYFFRDLGPLVLPVGSEGKLSPALEPDPSRHHLEDAEAVRRRFEEFYADCSFLPAAQLRQAFLAAFRDYAFPFPLTRFERRRNDEESWVRHMMDTGRKRQDASARANGDRVLRRDVHAKAHGLVEATFEVVLPANPQLRIGLFAAAGTYPAWLRPSNGQGRLYKDSRPDARGLALRVLLPKELGGKAPSYLLSGAEAGKQDFVLMNSPVFFAPDIKTLALLSAIDRVEGTFEKISELLALAARPGGLRHAFLLARSTSTKLRHPLAAEFHSATSYQLGDDYLVKYSIEPAAEPPALAPGNVKAPDLLAQALRASLDHGGIELRFFLHVLPTSSTPPGYGSLTDVVEDATIDWSNLGAEKVLVANIRIGAQDATSAERLREAEAMEFNPWHALVQHRPLGSLNRARLSAYRASQNHRLAQPAASLADAAE